MKDLMIQGKYPLPVRYTGEWTGGAGAGERGEPREISQGSPGEPEPLPPHTVWHIVKASAIIPMMCHFEILWHQHTE